MGLLGSPLAVVPSEWFYHTTGSDMTPPPPKKTPPPSKTTSPTPHKPPPPPAHTSKCAMPPWSTHCSFSVARHNLRNDERHDLRHWV